MGELLAYIRSGVPASLLVLLLAIHILTLLYARLGGRRAVRTAALHLAAFDWALAVGVTAGYRVASQPSSAWPSDPVTWGLMGVIFLFLPTWLLVRFGIRLSGMLLLPVMPTDRTQRTLAGRALQAYGWGLNDHFFREDDGELHRVVKAGKTPLARYYGDLR